MWLWACLYAARVPAAVAESTKVDGLLALPSPIDHPRLALEEMTGSLSLTWACLDRVVAASRRFRAMSNTEPFPPSVGNSQPRLGRCM